MAGMTADPVKATAGAPPPWGAPAVSYLIGLSGFGSTAAAAVLEEPILPR